MKIIQILSLLIFSFCYSCDRTRIADTNQIENERKGDSLSRVQFLAHSDSIVKMYTSITMPHNWNRIQIKNKKTLLRKTEDTLFVYKSIHIDISTEPQIDLICFLENGKSEVFNINSFSENADSIIFNSTRNMTNESMQWVFKYANKEKSLGQWSAYSPNKKKFVVRGKYTSLKDE